MDKDTMLLIWIGFNICFSFVNAYQAYRNWQLSRQNLIHLGKLQTSIDLYRRLLNRQKAQGGAE